LVAAVEGETEGKTEEGEEAEARVMDEVVAAAVAA